MLKEFFHKLILIKIKLWTKEVRTKDFLKKIIVIAAISCNKKNVNQIFLVLSAKRN